MKVITYTRTGTKAPETNLDKAVFEVAVTEDLLKQADLRAQANLRQRHAKTLTRAEVRGGGRKPWRQKGTGRARFGSTRVNIWRHGGVAHGPTGLQNYQKDMPKGMIQASIRMALSAQSASIKVIEQFNVSEAKTKLADQLLSKLEATGNVLLVHSGADDKFIQRVGNLPGVILVRFNQLRSYDILIADSIIIEKPALSELEVWLGKKSVKKTTVKTADKPAAKVVKKGNKKPTTKSTNKVTR